LRNVIAKGVKIWRASGVYDFALKSTEIINSNNTIFKSK